VSAYQKTIGTERKNGTGNFPGWPLSISSSCVVGEKSSEQ
jgi:hypothetical protein